MYEGKIIKFYREKAKFTQEQLGRGICSTTHLSKIERGLTEYSSEITDMLADKLEIDMQKEILNISTIKEKLDLWFEMVISQDALTTCTIEAELNNNPLMAASEYKTLFHLIKLLHHIKLGSFEKVDQQFKYLPKNIEEHSDFEQNLYKHVLGNYYMVKANHIESIRYLKSVDFEAYSNPIVYYDLASAYHHNKSPVLAYYYADKALHLYKKQNNFLGIIDTENLMIIQLESDFHVEFNETVERYENLLSLCDLVQAHDKKAKILHNFAYENLRKKNYIEAKKLYEQSMELKEKNSAVYLLSLEGFVRCSLEGGLLSEQKLLKHIDEGLVIADTINDALYARILTLLRYQILKQDKHYYKFLADKALPYFKTNGYVMITQRYKKELFTYYITSNQKEKALEIAFSTIDYVDS